MAVLLSVISYKSVYDRPLYIVPIYMRMKYSATLVKSQV